MMYSNKLVACIKVNGKILREIKDTVAVPFGSEYSIYIKNLSSVRALVKISIDGDNKTSNWLIVPANDSIEVERSIVGGNLEKGHRFKFIERTEQIEEHRGIKADDGLVRIEYKFEKVYQSPINVYTTSDNKWPNWNYQNTLLNCNTTPVRGGIGGQSCSTTMSWAPQSVTNTAGITAEGGISDQKFQYGSWFATENETHVLVLKLVGEVGGEKVSELITVKTKSRCHNCGMLNPFGNKFCPACGTGLQKL